MQQQGEELHKIPKELAKMVYDRLIARGTKRLKLRENYYKRINPEKSFSQIIMSQKNKHDQHLKKYKTANNTNSNRSGLNSEINDDDDARLLELMLPDVDQLDIDIEMLRLGQE